MTATDTNGDGPEKRIVRQSDNLGSRHSRLDGVHGAAVAVDTPEVFTEESIAVSGFAYDDEQGQVQLTLGSDISIGVWLDPADARALAEQLALAADEAEADIGHE